MAEKIFSKEKWLQCANEQMANGYITQQEIDNACKTWVDDMDGKTITEIGASEDEPINENWLISDETPAAEENTKTE